MNSLSSYPYALTRDCRAFTINKLQDAYDCDLDLGDTVNDIFEGESDPSKRMIKVVPSFINREFSVPASSNLHPGYVQKRLREINAEHANKRRRIGHHVGTQEELDPLRDQPVPTTESELSGEESASVAGINGVIVNGQRRRSQSGGSVIFMQGAQTGLAEFAPSIKEESPELGEPVAQSSMSGDHMATNGQAPQQQNSRPLSPALLSFAHPGFEPPALGEVQEPIDDNVDEANQEGQYRHEDKAMNGSPQPTPEGTQQVTAAATDERRDVYDVPSSPEFMSNIESAKKAKKTYGRSPRTASSVQKEVDLLNSSRSPKVNKKLAQTSLLKRGRVSQPLEDDDIESTPQDEVLAHSHKSRAVENREEGDLTDAFLETTNASLHNGFHSPDKTASARKIKVGKLRTPSKKFLQPTSTSDNNAKRNGFTEAASSTETSATTKLGTDIQARLDKINALKQKRIESPVVAPRASATPQSANRETSVIGAQSTNLVVGRALEQISPAPNPRDRSTSAAQLDASRLSSQPANLRPAPKQSPIPLPPNVREFEASTPSESFKRPLPKPKKTPRGGAGKSNSTPAQRRRTSPSSASAQRPTSAQKPQSSNLDQDNEDETPQVPLSTARTVIPESSVPTPDQPKKRGRPRKNPLPDPNTPRRPPGRPKKSALEATPASSTTPRDRGRAPRDSSATSPPTKKPASKIGPKKSKLANTSIEEDIAPQAAVDEAIVVSSRESSVESEPEPTPLTQELTEAPREAKFEQPATALSRRSAETAADDTPIQDTQEQSTTVNNADTAEDLEESIQADLQANSTPSDRERSARGGAHPRESTDWGFENVPHHVNDTGVPTTDVEHTAAQAVNDAPKPDSEPDEDDNTSFKSRSASVAVSNRSSPAVTRRPARFLSHSPTPVASDSGSEESGSPSKEATPKPIVEKENSEYDSDSTSDDDTTQDEEEDEDTAMPNATEVAPAKPNSSIATSQLQSSPPLHGIPASTPLAPSTSQPSRIQSIPKTPVPAPTSFSQTVHQTPIPTPGASQAPRSSQSVSGQAAARRPTARYAGFPGLREQLVGAQTKPVATPKKVYDPRMLNLGKLAAKGVSTPKIGVGLGDDDSSEDESSSSSSDSD